MEQGDSPPISAPRGWRIPDWVEPVLIVSILLTSMYFTRRRDYSILKPRSADYTPLYDASSSETSPRVSDDLEVGYGSSRGVIREIYPPKTRTLLGRFRIQTPNSSRFARHIHSRILQKFPFLVEMFYWAITYFFYRMTAGLSRAWYGGFENLWDVAQDHGLGILEIEATLLGQGDTIGESRWIEWNIQQWFLAGAEAGDWRGVFLTVLNRSYALIHIPGTVGFIAYYYATAPTHARFCTVRRTMSLVNLWAFLIFIFYPCTPPRLLPEEFGFVDTVNLENAQSVWMSGEYVNKLAAMPSMHFGYAFMIGCVFVVDSGILGSLFRRLKKALSEENIKDDVSEEDEILQNRSLWKRVAMFAFGVWYPSWVLLTIVATANHYFLDAFVASLGTLLSFMLNRILLNLLPLEDMLLWAWRLEKPVPTTGLHKRIVVR